WLIWLANLDFVSFEALPCQRGGIIEIAITLASPFSRFFDFFIVWVFFILKGEFSLLFYLHVPCNRP
ncbi:hypothetical protein ACRRA1_003013, partial [Vibrio parahaemolyticus]